MLDANGYLSALTNPELETTGFTYTDDGLMLAKTDARQNSSTVTYAARKLFCFTNTVLPARGWRGCCTRAVPRIPARRLRGR